MLDLTKKYIIHDISVKLYNGMPVWPGNRHKFLHSFAKLMDDNDEINLSRLDMSMHTGTHIDAPFHKINNGKKLNQINVENFMGSAQVIDLTHLKLKIKADDIRNIISEKVDFLLFKTRNSKYWAKNSFVENFIYFDKSAAELIADYKPTGVGIDYMSVDAYDAKTPVAHNAFFLNEILVYEGLNLNLINDGFYYFIGLPLNISDSEGSPVRALLYEESLVK